MSDEKVIHGAAISIDATDPEATAVSVWDAMVPVVFKAGILFKCKAQRAQYLATIAGGCAGVFAAEFGYHDAADLFEMLARRMRDAEAKNAGRPH